jgi:hypothetical protein
VFFHHLATVASHVPALAHERRRETARARPRVLQTAGDDVYRGMRVLQTAATM